MASLYLEQCSDRLKERVELLLKDYSYSYRDIVRYLQINNIQHITTSDLARFRLRMHQRQQVQGISTMHRKAGTFVINKKRLATPIANPNNNDKTQKRNCILSFQRINDKQICESSIEKFCSILSRHSSF